MHATLQLAIPCRPHMSQGWAGLCCASACDMLAAPWCSGLPPFQGPPRWLLPHLSWPVYFIAVGIQQHGVNAKEGQLGSGGGKQASRQGGSGWRGVRGGGGTGRERCGLKDEKKRMRNGPWTTRGVENSQLAILPGPCPHPCLPKSLPPMHDDNE